MNRQFSALSGLAMALIVLNHSIHMGLTLPEEWGLATVQGGGRFILSALQALGVFAVPVFLFISGAFVAYAARGKPPRLTYSFIFTGLRHILLPYAFWSIVFYLVVFLTSGTRFSLGGYLKNLIVGYPFHFIPLLAFFYLLSPLLVWWGRRHAWTLMAAIGGYQLVLIFLANAPAMGIGLPAGARLLIPPVLGETMTDWAIYFPLGLVYNLHAAALKPWLQRARWVFVLSAGLFFILGFIDTMPALATQLARHFSPLAAVFTIPVIKRNAIPLVKPLERIGKRSYGLYLTHLIVLDITLLAIRATTPVLLQLPVILFPVLFAIALAIPLWLMGRAAHGPARRIYRLVFG